MTRASKFFIIVSNYSVLGDCRRNACLCESKGHSNEIIGVGFILVEQFLLQIQTTWHLFQSCLMSTILYLYEIVWIPGETIVKNRNERKKHIKQWKKKKRKAKKMSEISKEVRKRELQWIKKWKKKKKVEEKWKKENKEWEKEMNK